MNNTPPETNSRRANAGNAKVLPGYASAPWAVQMPLTGLPLPALPAFHTDNPREIRIVCALANAPCTREELDRIAGASNVPDAIAALRRKGLDIPACREPVVDRDEEVVYRGRYRFTDLDLIRTRHLWESKAATAFGRTYGDAAEPETGLFRKGEAARREAALAVYATALGLRVSGAWIGPLFGTNDNPCRWTGGTETFSTSPTERPCPALLIKEVASNWDTKNQPPEHEAIRLVLRANYAAMMELAKKLRCRRTLGPGYFRVWEKKIQRGNHG